MSFKNKFKIGWSFTWRQSLWQLTTLPLLIIMLVSSSVAQEISTVRALKIALLVIVVTTLIRELISIYIAGHVFQKVKQKYEKEENRTLYFK